MESLLALLTTAPLLFVASIFFFLPEIHLSDHYPNQFTPNLLSFLASKNVSTTHFMIGYNMLIHLPQFLDIMNAGDDIAVHTWSHPYMTGLSNMQIVAEVSFVPPVLNQENRLNNLLALFYNANDLRDYRSCPCLLETTFR